MTHARTIVAFAMCGALLVVAGCRREQAPTVSADAAPAIAVIPAPKTVTPGTGVFRVTAQTPVHFTDDDSEVVARYFTDLLQRTRGLELTVASGDAGQGAIRFKLLEGGNKADDESYSLVTTADAVTVTAAGPRGLFYGAVTLWQLLTGEAGDAASIALPVVTIEDSPRFRWRGLMLDSARHFQSPEYIKQFIDWMAVHKLNVLHWHLTDDQAWRLEIRKHPRLTQIGAWRVPAGAAAAADIDPATGKPRLYGGFYSQQDVRDIVAYAAQRHITIVPEIETPGHASALLAAYPQFGVSGQAHEVPADWGIYSALYNIDDTTFGFLEDVLSEVMELFPGQYIHVGGDEAVKDEWRNSPRIQAQMRKLGIKDEHALQSYFIQRLEKFLSAHGRRLIGWDEILEGGLAPNATVMSWRGIDGAVAAARAGHDTVLSPWPTLYFDNRQAHDDQPGRGRLITLEDVYRFDPAPASLTPQERQHILGVQANLWSEHMRSEDRVTYMAFPRAAALAEVAWSPEDRIDWDDFQRRLPVHLARLDSLGVRYARAPDPVPSVPGRRTSHQLDLCSDKLVLALEDDAPLQGPRATFLVDIMNPCWIYRAADLANVAAIEVSVGQVPFNFQIGKDVNAIPLPAPQTPEGELEVRLDTCEGAKLVSIPLAPAVANPAVTRLPAASIAPQTGQHDLCFVFTRRKVDPTWVIDTVQLLQK